MLRNFSREIALGIVYFIPFISGAGKTPAYEVAFASKVAEVELFLEEHRSKILREGKYQGL